MKKLAIVIFILLIIQVQAAFSVQNDTIPYQDPQFSCISTEKANQYITDFHIDTVSFGGIELCDSSKETKKLFNDLQIIEQAQFNDVGENNLIKGFVAKNKYYEWMKKQTYGVQRGNDVPYATAYNSGGYFTMQDGWAKLSTLGRVGTIIHEARHTAGYRHIPCKQGPYQGLSLDGCDSNYNYAGSHAVEMEYYARVSVQGVNFHPVYKKMARLMAIARSSVFFNKSPIQVREAVLGLNADTTDNFAYLYDQQSWFKKEIPNQTFHPEQKLKRTGFGAVIFDGIQAFAVEMYKNSGFSDAIQDNYSYFKLLIENKKSIKEFEEFDIGTKRYVVQISKDNKISKFQFAQGAWGNEQNIPFNVVKASTAIAGQVSGHSQLAKGLYLISDNQDIFSYNPETQKMQKEIGTWDVNYKKVIHFNNQNLILQNDGQVLVQDNQSLQNWIPAQDKRFSDLVAVPLYDAFEVNKE